MNIINKFLDVFRFVQRTEGKIFSVTFINAEGQRRVMNVKTLKQPRVPSMRYVVIENNLRQRAADPDIRSFRATRVLKMKCGNEQLNFEQAA